MKPSTPADRYELLAQATELLNEVRLGHRAFQERMSEMADGGLSSGGFDAGGTSAREDTATEARLIWGSGDHTDRRKHAERRADPAARVWSDFDALLHRVHREASKLARVHREHVVPAHGTTLLSDPGCSLCAELSKPTKPVHSATYLHVCARHHVGRCAECDRKKSARVPICEFCYSFSRRNGRVPTRQERQAHHEGRRVRVQAS